MSVSVADQIQFKRLESYESHVKLQERDCKTTATSSCLIPVIAASATSHALLGGVCCSLRPFDLHKRGATDQVAQPPTSLRLVSLAIAALGPTACN